MGYRNIILRAAVTGIVAAALIGAPAQAQPAAFSGSADLAVDLSAWGGLVLPSARYTVTVTNHGPDPAASTVVTVQLDRRAYSVSASPCAYDPAADTVTCTFGGTPVGGTGTAVFWVYYLLRDLDVVWTTATRTASVPADPDSANDADSVDCQWFWYEGLPSMNQMFCS